MKLSEEMGIGALVVGVLVAFALLVSYLSRSNIGTDCDKVGAFYVDGRIYSCERVTD